MVEGVTDLVHGSMKRDSHDEEADPDQLFWALGHVNKDIIYDIADDIEHLKMQAKAFAGGNVTDDPLGNRAMNVLYDFAYATQKAIRSGGSLHAVYLKILTTQSQHMKYEQITRGEKADGMMKKGGGFFGFGGNKAKPQTPME